MWFILNRRVLLNEAIDIVNGYFTFDATLPGIITSYNVYDSTTLDSTTLIGSGDKST